MRDERLATTPLKAVNDSVDQLIQNQREVIAAFERLVAKQESIIEKQQLLIARQKELLDLRQHTARLNQFGAYFPK